MRIARAITRRAFSRALGGTLLSLFSKAAPCARLEWTDGSGARPVAWQYRADAQVLVLGLPFFHRQGVGGGSVVWRESTEADGGMLRLLEFDGYSIPTRAAGLNRLGFIRELSRWTDGKSAESIYFGLMTASPEESAEQARGALHSAAKEQAYSVIDGRVVATGSEDTSAHFLAPATLSAAQRPELMERAQKALAAAVKATGGPAAPQGEAQSFLQSLAELLRRPERSECSYVYSGRLYSLWVTRTPDPKTTAYFRARHLLPQDGNIVRVAGKLRRQAGGPETDFRLWVEQGAGRPLPLRIEYQAKSYLRLVFEAVSL
jgi:hypothetical protein